ncbi:N-acyl-phosphatidylethanolamine-hydrolyzing phospholipase D [Kwoniella heveanensis CBS 569]|nr:N-acyl-phosphatidylethanolamine-hydrolyzing phospholipase D [Kwoniella heveanensis CBS 569]
MSSSRPSVTLIPPPSNLPREHHGPFKPSKPDLLTSINPLASAPPQPDINTDSDRPFHKPKYFKNPWPSYRSASLHDAYLAYQLGAAVALPPHKTPGSSKLGLVDEEPFGEYEDENNDDPRDGEGSLRAEAESMIPKGLYIRPDFAEVREDDEKDDWRDPPVEVVEPNWGDGADKRERVTWLGHAGVLVQIPWKDGKEATCGVIFDPIFSYRCSPSQYVGPARYLDPPCPVSMLPEIHACCISHDHYDHLDYYTIMDLWKYHQATIHFFVPMGLKQWFTSSGIPGHRVTELDWWHETLLTFPTEDSRYRDASFDAGADVSQHNDDTYPPPTGTQDGDPRLSTETDYTSPSSLSLKLAFTPAQHRSGRGVFDHMTTLWGSWCLGVVEEEDKALVGKRGMNGWKGFKVFFGGDTGYRYATAVEGDDTAICPAFEHIAEQYSPFNLSLLPLSTGSSLPFLRTVLSLSLDQYTLTSSLHCSPADSLEIHRIIRAERSLGIHWGTFCDADEARGTRVDFGRCRRRVGVSGAWEDQDDGATAEGRFVVGDIGQTFVLPSRKG